MADKALSEMNEEEIAALSDEERQELEDAEEGDGEPGSERRRSLYQRFRKTNEDLRKERERADNATREANELRMRQIAREEGGGGRAEEEVDEEPVAPERPAAFDYAAARAKKKALLVEGNFEGAAAVEETIDAANEALEKWRTANDDYRDLISERRIAAAAQTGATAAQRAENAAVGSVIAQVYETYPFLDIEDKEGRDMDAIDAVIARRDRYVASGMTKAAAIQKAAKEIGPRFAKMHDDDGKGEGGKGGKGGGRAQEERERGARESDKLPPNTMKTGMKNLPRDETGAVDPSKMTDAQIAALTPQQIAEIGAQARRRGSK